MTPSKIEFSGGVYIGYSCKMSDSDLERKIIQKVIDDNLLRGDAREIVKCLRDGLNSSDLQYVHLCLSIIACHFNEIDRVLNLIPSGIRKDELQKLAKESDE